LNDPESNKLRNEWTDRQRTYGNSPRAVLPKGLHPRVNELIDAWHRDLLRFAFSARHGVCDGLPTLDLGCGYGRLASEAVTLPLGVVVGIDFALGFCRKFQDDYGRAVCGDIVRLPFVDGAFGAAYVVTALMYLPMVQAQQALSEIDRCIAPGTRILLVEPSAEFNRVAHSLTPGKSQAGLAMPGFGARHFERELAPATWTRVATGSSVWFTLALPLLALTARSPAIFGRLRDVILRLDRPGATVRDGWLARFALHRWTVFEKPSVPSRPSSSTGLRRTQIQP
jgi:SAM-dependent methyltransferase